jgi:hypothetical protein
MHLDTSLLGPLPKLASRTAGRVTGLLCNGSLRLRRSTAVCSTDRDNDVTGVGRPSRPSPRPGPRTVIFDGRLRVMAMAVFARLAAAAASGSAIQAGGRQQPLATVRARIPRVARNAPSDITGKIPAVFQAGSMDDQS